MTKNNNMIEAIKIRKSVRVYSDESPSLEAENQINQILDQRIETPFGNYPRFKLISFKDSKSEDLKGLGTYGMIKNCKSYIVGLIKDNKCNLEDFGYAFEKIILELTNMNLGTCWLGGTFTKSSFAEKSGALDSEIIPAVVALGNASEKSSIADKIIKLSAGSHKRKPWKEIFFNQSFKHPIEKEVATEWKIPLKMVRMAPSASNKQPWRVVIDQDKQQFHFFLQHSKSYRKMGRFLKLADLQHIDVGIAMCHLELSLKEMKISGKWDISPPKLSLPENTEYIISFEI